MQKPTAEAMHGAGYYNAHSAQQAEAVDAALQMLERAAREVPLAADSPLAIADFGSSEGRNSLAPLSAAVDALRSRSSLPILVTHTDLPGNDFSSLFRVVAGEPGSYKHGEGVFTYAVGRSFYEPLFPPSSLTLGWSSTAVLWLSEAPCDLPDHLFSFLATGPQRALWADRAAQDWQTFLALRASELRPGGQLVLTTPIAAPAYRPWMELVEAGAGDAVNEGVISQADLERMAIPTYLRESDDLPRPFQDSSMGLELLETTIITAPDPAWETYRIDGDRDRYTTSALAALRAWAEPSLAAAIPDDPHRPVTLQGLFACIESRLRATPTPCEWTIALLRARSTP